MAAAGEPLSPPGEGLAPGSCDRPSPRQPIALELGQMRAECDGSRSATALTASLRAGLGGASSAGEVM